MTRTITAYDPEDGRTAQAEALQARIRDIATCRKCELLDGQPGKIVLDSAGSGELKRRRFKCNRCKATLSVGQYLAVYSGQADLSGDTAPDAARRMDISGNTSISSENPPSGVLEPQSHTRPIQAARRPTTALIASTAQHTAQQARDTVQASTHQAIILDGAAATHADSHAPRTAALPIYYGQSNTGHSDAIIVSGHFTSDDRCAYIERTLDRLGLVGLGRKRRRQALEVLLPAGRPSKACLVRVAIPCGNVNAAAAREAIRALKVDPRLIHHVVKTDAGIELIVMERDAATIKAKALHQGVVLSEPKARRPSTRKECDALLKALTPAANTAQHEATREYLRDWVDEIKANMPAHIRAPRQETATVVTRPNNADATTAECNTATVQLQEEDPLDAINFGGFDEDGPRSGRRSRDG